MEPKQISCRRSSLSPTRYQSFIAKNMESYNQCGINDLTGGQVQACFHGWMILLDNHMWALWNPSTSEFIRLPPLTHKEDDFYDCCLSSPPDDQGSVFLLFSEEIPTILFFRMDCERKRLKWSEVSYAEQLSSISGINGLQLAYPTCYNGKVYAMTMGLEYMFIIQVDIVVKGKEVVISLLSFVKVPPYVHPGFSSRNNVCNMYCFLKGSCTELFYIIIYFEDETRIGLVSLFKLDMTSMMWEKMEDLKDAIFFLELSTWSVFYKSVAASKIEGYVHIYNNMNKILHSFYVLDRTMSLSLMHSTICESQVLVWAMLECRLEGDHIESNQEEKDKEIEIVIRPVKSNVIEFHSTKSESRVLNVPFHILEMIMEHCVGVEYIKFRATCKLCHLAAPRIQ